mmetsp:Transcript_58983/g.140837  ORF Transcript_58983/g.140837 Transcript_58983/m.140837 type:complete len:210 (-) Transcript_58983:389-1018(-)
MTRHIYERMPLTPAGAKIDWQENKVIVTAEAPIIKHLQQPALSQFAWEVLYNQGSWSCVKWPAPAVNPTWPIRTLVLWNRWRLFSLSWVRWRGSWIALLLHGHLLFRWHRHGIYCTNHGVTISVVQCLLTCIVLIPAFHILAGILSPCGPHLSAAAARSRHRRLRSHIVLHAFLRAESFFTLKLVPFLTSAVRGRNVFAFCLGIIPVNR